MGAGFILRFFCRIAGGFEGKSGVFYNHIARLNLGCIFVFCGVFLFCLEGIFCGAACGWIFLPLFLRRFRGAARQGVAQRSYARASLRHEKGVADNESGGFLSGAIFIAFAYGNSRSFYSSRGAKSGGAVFFPLPKKKKNFHIRRKTKNFALRLFDARILSLYVE